MVPKLTASVLVAGTGVLLFYFYPNVFHTFHQKFTLSHYTMNYVATIAHSVFFGNKVTKSSSNNDPRQQTYRLFSMEELKRYDGTVYSSGLYLAILGEVFDVEKGSQHYKPGAGYSFFTGRDASRAYVTGDFSDEGLIDDVSDLDDTALLGIEDWMNFYRDEYPFMGKIVGRYYDRDGKPTSELLEVRKRINNAHANKWVKDREKEVFPPCNSEWSRQKGSRVWCSTQSGGIDRKWVGVPRKFLKVGNDPRCVCVRNFGPPSSSRGSTDHQNRGDLDHPSLEEYEYCSSDSESCMVDHP